MLGAERIEVTRQLLGKADTRVPQGTVRGQEGTWALSMRRGSLNRDEMLEYPQVCDGPSLMD